MVHNTCLLHYELVVVKNGKVRNSTYVITGGQIRMPFSIYLENNCPTCHVG